MNGREPSTVRSGGQEQHPAVRRTRVTPAPAAPATGWFPSPWCLVAPLILASLIGCKKAERSPVLASVGEHQIRMDDFRKEVDRRQALRQPLPDREALLEEMITHQALLQRARQAGLDQDPAVQREIQFLLISRFRERHLATRLEAVTVAPEEVKAAYDQDLARYTQPAQVRLALLFLKKDRLMSEAKTKELRARMTEAREQAIVQPASGGRGPAAQGFGALAIRYSDDPASRYRGGDIGWMEPDHPKQRWPGVVIEAGLALEPGQVSDVIETEDGLYLAMKTDARPSRVTPIEEVRAALHQSLLARKRRALEATFRQEAAQQAGVRIHRDALASVTMPVAVATLAQGQETNPPALPAADDARDRN